MRASSQSSSLLAHFPILAEFFYLGHDCAVIWHGLKSLARAEEPSVPPEIMAYLNRLGDLLFVLARAANAEAGRPDVPWRKGSG